MSNFTYRLWISIYGVGETNQVHTHGTGEENAVPDVWQLPLTPSSQYEGEGAEEEGMHVKILLRWKCHKNANI